MRKILSQNVDTCKSEVGSGRPSVSGKKMPPRPPIMAKPPIVINGIMPPRPITNGAPILPTFVVIFLNVKGKEMTQFIEQILQCLPFLEIRRRMEWVAPITVCNMPMIIQVQYQITCPGIHTLVPPKALTTT